MPQGIDDPYSDYPVLEESAPVAVAHPPANDSADDPYADYAVIEESRSPTGLAPLKKGVFDKPAEGEDLRWELQAKETLGKLGFDQKETRSLWPHLRPTIKTAIDAVAAGQISQQIAAEELAKNRDALRELLHDRKNATQQASTRVAEEFAMPGRDATEFAWYYRFDKDKVRKRLEELLPGADQDEITQAVFDAEATHAQMAKRFYKRDAKGATVANASTGPSGKYYVGNNYLVNQFFSETTDPQLEEDLKLGRISQRQYEAARTGIERAAFRTLTPEIKRSIQSERALRSQMQGDTPEAAKERLNQPIDDSMLRDHLNKEISRYVSTYGKGGIMEQEANRLIDGHIGYKFAQDMGVARDTLLGATAGVGRLGATVGRIGDWVSQAFGADRNNAWGMEANDWHDAAESINRINDNAVEKYSTTLPKWMHRSVNRVASIFTEAYAAGNLGKILGAGGEGAVSASRMKQLAAELPVIFEQGLSEASQNYREGMDNGLEGKQLFAYAAGQGIIEAGITALFSAAGRGGFEKQLAKGQTAIRRFVGEDLARAISEAGKGWTGAIKAGSKDLIDELGEEEIVEAAHQIFSRVMGQRQDATAAEMFENFGEAIANVALDTLLLTGSGAAAGRLFRNRTPDAWAAVLKAYGNDQAAYQKAMDRLTLTSGKKLSELDPKEQQTIVEAMRKEVERVENPYPANPDAWEAVMYLYGKDDEGSKQAFNNAASQLTLDSGKKFSELDPQEQKAMIDASKAARLKVEGPSAEEVLDAQRKNQDGYDKWLKWVSAVKAAVGFAPSEFVREAGRMLTPKAFTEEERQQRRLSASKNRQARQQNAADKVAESPEQQAAARAVVESPMSALAFVSDNPEKSAALLAPKSRVNANAFAEAFADTDIPTLEGVPGAKDSRARFKKNLRAAAEMPADLRDAVVQSMQTGVPIAPPPNGKIDETWRAVKSKPAGEGIWYIDGPFGKFARLTDEAIAAKKGGVPPQLKQAVETRAQQEDFLHDPQTAFAFVTVHGAAAVDELNAESAASFRRFGKGENGQTILPDMHGYSNATRSRQKFIDNARAAANLNPEIAEAIRNEIAGNPIPTFDRFDPNNTAWQRADSKALNRIPKVYREAMQVENTPFGTFARVNPEWTRAQRAQDVTAPPTAEPTAQAAQGVVAQEAAPAAPITPTPTPTPTAGGTTNVNVQGQETIAPAQTGQVTSEAPTVEQGQGNVPVAESAPTDDTLMPAPADALETALEAYAEHLKKTVRPDRIEGSMAAMRDYLKNKTPEEAIAHLNKLMQGNKPTAKAASPAPAKPAESKKPSKPHVSELSDDDRTANEDVEISRLKKYGINVTPVNPESDAERQAAALLEESTGKQVFFFTQDAKDAKQLSGLATPTDFILLKRGMDKESLWWTVGHELSHATGIDAKILAMLPPEMVKEYGDARIKQNPELYAETAKAMGLTLDQVRDREGAADIVGSFLSDKSFRDGLLAKDRGTWQKIIDAIKSWLKWSPTEEESDERKAAKEVVQAQLDDIIKQSEKRKLSSKPAESTTTTTTTTTETTPAKKLTSKPGSQTAIPGMEADVAEREMLRPHVNRAMQELAKRLEGKVTDSYLGELRAIVYKAMREVYNDSNWFIDGEPRFYDDVYETVSDGIADSIPALTLNDIPESLRDSVNFTIKPKKSFQSIADSVSESINDVIYYEVKNREKNRPLPDSEPTAPTTITQDIIDNGNKSLDEMTDEELSALLDSNPYPGSEPTTPAAPPAKVNKPAKKLSSKKAENLTVTTQSGRSIPAPPQIRLDSNRKTTNDLKALDQWLAAQAVAEAEARGDDYNLSQFSGGLTHHMTPAGRDAANQYLFGETDPQWKIEDGKAVRQDTGVELMPQPKVLPPLLKPLSSKPSKPETPPTEPPAAPKSDVQQAWDRLTNYVKKNPKMFSLMGGVDPELMGIAKDLTIALVKSGVRKFADVIRGALAQFKSIGVGPDIVRKIQPVLEHHWETIGKARPGAVDKVSDVEHVYKEHENANSNGSGEGTGPDAGMGNGPDSSSMGATGDTSGTSTAGPEGGRPPRESTGGGLSTGDVSGNPAPSESGPGSDTGTNATGNAPTAGGRGGRRPTSSNPRGGNQGESNTDSGRGPTVKNHRIGPNDVLAIKNEATKYRNNVAAIKLLRQLDAENREATPEEKRILAGYTGWGGVKQVFAETKAEASRLREEEGKMVAAFNENWHREWYPRHKELKALLTPDEWATARQSIQFAHYTSKEVVGGMWQAAEHLGFTGGNAGELSAGIGHMIGLMPDQFVDTTKWTAVEPDNLSAAIIAKLYPEARVLQKYLQDVGIAPGSLALAMTNVPFNRQGPSDARKRYGLTLNLHNYMIARNIDALKPGGIAIIISTSNTMQAAADQREFLASRANLVGAIRLPNNAFQESANTEVSSDILIFRKPMKPGEAGAPWTQLREVQTAEGPIMVNEYFADHPEMVLGTHSMQGKMYGDPDDRKQYTVMPDGRNLGEAIREAVSNLPPDVFDNSAADLNPIKIKLKGEGALKDGALVYEKGKILLNLDGELIDPRKHPDEKVANRWIKHKDPWTLVQDFIPLRDGYRNHVLLMGNPDATDPEIDESRTNLEKLYDKFVQKHGQLNASTGGASKTLLRVDPGYYLSLGMEQAIETYDPAKKRLNRRFVKSEVFGGRTIDPTVAPQTAENIEDAIRSVSSYYGVLDTNHVARLLNKTAEEIETELSDKGLAYLNPDTAMWEPANLYLAGNVRQKLAAAELAAEADPKYAKNVEALRKSQPELGTIEDGKVRYDLSQTYVDTAMIVKFARDVMGYTGDKITYEEKADRFIVELTDDDWENPDLISRWGVRGEQYSNDPGARKAHKNKIYNGMELLDMALNNGRPNMTIDSYDDEGNVISRRPDEKANDRAKELIQTIRNRWLKWVLETPDVKAKIEADWNERFNFWKRPEWDGSHLSLPGMNHSIFKTHDLRDYQKSAIYRALMEGQLGGMIGVGGGKTYVMAAIAMENRRLGVAKRQTIVVQNSTLGQFVSQFQRLYPNAKLLYPSESDMDGPRRKAFLSRVITSDFDALIIPKSWYNKIPVNPKRAAATIEENIRGLREYLIEQGLTESKPQRGSTQAHIEAQIQKFQDLLDRVNDEATDRQDDILEWENLGIDRLFVDEAHDYKKPPFVTKHTRLKGVDTSFGSESLQHFMKVREVQGRNGGRGVYLFTGTPITNTMGEAYHMLNYLVPEKLREFGIKTFDQFVGGFLKIEDSFDQNSAQQWVLTQAITRFTNRYAFSQLVNSAWFVKTTDELEAEMRKAGEHFPVLVGGRAQKKLSQPDPAFEQFNNWLLRIAEQWKALPGRERMAGGTKAVPTMLYGAGLTASIDMRLVLPNSPDSPNSKLSVAAENAAQIYHATEPDRLTQAIFLDTHNLRDISKLHEFEQTGMVHVEIEEYTDPETGEKKTRKKKKKAKPAAESKWALEELKRKLIAQGVKEEEIAIIPYVPIARREHVFEQIQRGEIRIAIGGTADMGIGVNMQNKLYAMHHIDAKWRPDEMKQRLGRMLRSGNENNEVYEFYYGIEGSLDSAVFAKLARKVAGIEDAISGQGTEDIDFSDDSTGDPTEMMEDAMAYLSGNPNVIKKLNLQRRVQSLKSDRDAFEDEKMRLAKDLDRNEKEIKQVQAAIKAGEERVAKTAELDGVVPPINWNGKNYDNHADVAKEIQATINAKVADIIAKTNSGELDVDGKWTTTGKTTLEGLAGTLQWTSADDIPAVYKVADFKVGDVRVRMFAAGKSVMFKDENGRLNQEIQPVYKTDIRLPGENVNLYNGNAATSRGAIEAVLKLPQTMRDALQKNNDRLAVLRQLRNKMDAITMTEWAGVDELAESEQELAKITAQLTATKNNNNGNQGGNGQGNSGPTTSRAMPQPGGRTQAANGKPIGTNQGLEGSTWGPAAQDIKALKPLPPTIGFKLATDLTGNEPVLSSRLRKAWGLHKADAQGNERILLNPKAAADPAAFAAVLAHEVGHSDSTAIKALRYITRKMLESENFPFPANATKVEKERIRKQMMAERRDLSQWWRPWNPKTAPDSYKKYRNSRSETYADLISVLLMSPGDVQSRAPLHYQGIMHLLNTKTEFYDALVNVYDVLNGTPEVLSEHRDALLGERKLRSDQKMQAIAIDAEASNQSVTHWLTSLLQATYNRNKPAVNLANKAAAESVNWNRRDELKAMLDEMFYVDSAVKDVLSAYEEKVHQQYLASGLSPDEFNDIMYRMIFLKRVEQGRKKTITAGPVKFDEQIANPGMWNPQEAREQLDYYKAKYGPQKWAKIQKVLDGFYEVTFDYATKAADNGVIRPKTYVETIVPNKDNYAAFLALRHFNDLYVSPKLKQMVGNLGDVVDPYRGTVLKMVSLARFSEMNRIKRDFYKLGMAVVLKAGDDYHEYRKPFRSENDLPKPRKGFEWFTFLDDGKPRAFEVEESLAQVFRKHDLGVLNSLSGIIQKTFYKTLYGALVTYSPRFAIGNIPRDLSRTYTHMGAYAERIRQRYIADLKSRGYSDADATRLAKSTRVSLWQVVKQYMKALPVGIQRALGNEPAIVRQMMSERAIAEPFASMFQREDSPIADLTASITSKKLTTDEKLEQKPFLYPVAKFMKFWRLFSEASETASKVAGYRILTAMQNKGVPVTDTEKAYVTRNFVGTPNYLQAGLATPVTNALWTFSKIKMNAIGAAAELASKPATRTTFLLRNMYGNFFNLMWLGAKAGIFGKTAMWIAERLPKMLLDNYVVLPIGGGTEDDDRYRIWVMALPMDEQMATINKIVSRLIDGKPGEAVTSLLKDIIPAPNPIISAASKWYDFAMNGQNPFDEFRQRKIMPEIAHRAGGWDALRYMVGWTIGQAGAPGRMVQKLIQPVTGDPNTGAKTGAWETAYNVAGDVTGLGRIFRTYNRLQTDDQYAKAQVEDQLKARRILSLPDTAKNVYTQWTRSTHGKPTTADQMAERLLLDEWHSKYFQPLTRKIWVAEENGDKTAQRNAENQLDQSAKDFRANWRNEVPRALKALEQRQERTLRSNSAPRMPGETPEHEAERRLKLETSKAEAKRRLSAIKGQ